MVETLKMNNEQTIDLTKEAEFLELISDKLNNEFGKSKEWLVKGILSKNNDFINILFRKQ